MTTLLQLRDLLGQDLDLAVVAGHFANPDQHTITESVDLRHFVAVPGLADCHAHFAAASIPELVSGTGDTDLEMMTANGRTKLEAGVLLAADKGSKTDSSLRYLDVPPSERPDIEMAGRIIATPGGYYEGFADEVADGDLPFVVDQKARTAAQWIKLVGDWPRRGQGAVPNFSETALAASVAVAHSRGKRVAIHTMSPETAGRAVRAGVDSIEHGLFLTDQDVEVLGGRGGAWVPTIAAVEALVLMLGPHSSGGKLLRDGLGRVRDLLPGAFRLGVNVLAGTDLSVPHGHVAIEAERMVAYGVAPEDAVTAITSGAYGYLKRPTPMHPGAPADVVLLRGDPRENISILQDPAIVLRLGAATRGGI